MRERDNRPYLGRGLAVVPGHDNLKQAWRQRGGEALFIHRRRRGSGISSRALGLILAVSPLSLPLLKVVAEAAEQLGQGFCDGGPRGAAVHAQTAGSSSSSSSSSGVRDGGRSPQSGANRGAASRRSMAQAA